MAVAGRVELVFNHLPAVARRMLGATDAAILASALRIQAGAQVRTPVRTGLLRRSWAVRATRGGQEVYNPVVYAKFVEWGTRRMAARGMLTQAVAAERGRLPFLVGAAIKEAAG